MFQESTEIDVIVVASNHVFNSHRKHRRIFEAILGGENAPTGDEENGHNLICLIHEPGKKHQTHNRIHVYASFPFTIKSQSNVGRCTIHGSCKNELFHEPSHNKVNTFSFIAQVENTVILSPFSGDIYS